MCTCGVCKEGEKREKMKKEELWREGSRFSSQQAPAHRQGVVVYMSQVEMFVITIKMESCLSQSRDQC